MSGMQWSASPLSGWDHYRDKAWQGYDCDLCGGHRHSGLPGICKAYVTHVQINTWYIRRLIMTGKNAHYGLSNSTSPFNPTHETSYINVQRHLYNFDIGHLKNSLITILNRTDKVWLTRDSVELTYISVQMSAQKTDLFLQIVTFKPISPHWPQAS